MKLICWNVNGIRAVEKKGALEWLWDEKPDVICLQETKAQPDQLSAMLQQPEGYHSYFSSAEKKGYSGVAVYAKTPLANVRLGFGLPEFDNEGRIVSGEIIPNVRLYNIYFPNGKASPERLDFKMRFYDAMLDRVKADLAAGRDIIICGDVNTAHREIDLARPKDNEKSSGFLPMERAWIGQLLAAGMVDIFRQRHPEPDQYSWWDMKTRARDRNIGWRIDYFFISQSLVSRVVEAQLLPDRLGSDHCPLSLEIG